MPPVLSLAQGNPYYRAYVDEDALKSPATLVRQWRPDTRPWPEKPGTYEVTQFPERAAATEAERQRARDLIAATEAAAERHNWYRYSAGLREGYTTTTHLDKYHFVNKAYLSDGDILNPDRPEFLMYARSSTGMRLTGVMYLMPTTEARGPQIGGPKTVWHYHILGVAMCWHHGLPVAKAADEPPLCERGSPGLKSPEMLHVWLLDNPKGRFATYMKPPE